jgi:hypothetical protein
MNTLTVDSISAFDHAFRPGLSIERLRSQAPAAFAENPFGRVSPSYRFISTRELVAALFDAGFAATEARQARARGERAGYARHLLRFRPLRTEVAVTEAIPEIIVVNAHDGTSAHLRWILSCHHQRESAGDAPHLHPDLRSAVMVTGWEDIERSGSPKSVGATLGSVVSEGMVAAHEFAQRTLRALLRCRNMVVIAEDREWSLPVAISA